MRGGMPPTREPTHVLAMLSRFIGVYTMVYSRIFARPSPAVKGLTMEARVATPATPVAGGERSVPK